MFTVWPETEKTLAAEKIMQPEWLIIDGYNVLHQSDDLAELIHTDIQAARHRLVRQVENTAHRMAPQTTIVFDGREAGGDAALTSTHLEVCFSPGNLSADTVIERLVTKFPTPEKILVVTSDHAEHDTVSSAGAQVMSSQEFIARCEQDSRRPVPKRTPPGKEPKLGDLFPDGM
jgi:predicted RNA-binding protein with PIN domain